jgi:hypothetical protein
MKNLGPTENIGSTTRDYRARPLGEILTPAADHRAEIHAILSGIVDVPYAKGDGSSANLLGWDRRVSENFAPGWFIGSDGDNGEHLQEPTGWPYSVYRKNTDVGGVDIVLCHGIQDRRDAEALAAILNGRK